MLTEALSYPRRGDGWWKKIAIGGLLLIFSFLVVPAIVLYGYLVRVSRSAATEDGNATPPPFDDWGEMLVDGLKFIVIGIAYIAIPYIVLIAALALSGNGGSVVISVVGIVAGIGLILASYVLPVATTNFAVHDSLGAAFDFGTVFGAAFTGRYFVSIVIAFVVSVVLGFIAGLLSIVIVGLFLTFYLTVVIAYLYATGCGPALTDGVESTEQPSTESVKY